MLRIIEVDGFRSLLKFKIELRQGLNILVGANGTGKSNFIGFLDFLSTFIGSDLNTAVAGAEGAGAVFSKERFIGSKSASLSIRVSGTLDPVDPERIFFYSSDPDTYSNIDGGYEYSCSISYDSSIPAVYISKEQISINSKGEDVFQLFRDTYHLGDAFDTKVQIESGDQSLLKRFMRFSSKTESKSAINNYFSTRVSPERSVLAYISPEMSELIVMTMDLSGYKSVNIDPSIARKPSPVGSLISLGANGSGLAGALYQLKNNNYYPGQGGRRFTRSRISGSETFHSIMSWCKEVNPEIEDIRVELDHMEAQIRPSMYFNMGDRSQGFPFSRISDGTVKWLTLATALFAERNLNLIEEPENFLHPFMQESFVALCRQAIEESTGRVLIVSTHSPTVLDCCEPNELTMFEISSGETRASRIANREQLSRKIESSRFGMGYYYKIGAVYGEDSSDC